MIFDVIGCSLICILQLIKLFAIAIVIQFLVYKISNKKLSIYNEFRRFIMKEVNDKKIEQNRRGKHFAQSK